MVLMPGAELGVGVERLVLLVLPWSVASRCFSCRLRKEFSSGSSVRRVKYATPATSPLTTSFH